MEMVKAFAAASLVRIMKGNGVAVAVMILLSVR
ncbi:hypothetical protein P245_16570 [Comamonas thiooxydans]|uniref:Uncharacterized protein n=1 Tax=Comamonas thiooxydans TaxID=363952 RepID=A0A0E3C055_9BURK|nr:hypothetical protein P245_16570 [Comamonas thiooxydans]